LYPLRPLFEERFRTFPVAGFLQSAGIFNATKFRLQLSSPPISLHDQRNQRQNENYGNRSNYHPFCCTYVSKIHDMAPSLATDLSISGAIHDAIRAIVRKAARVTIGGHLTVDGRFTVLAKP
jgi:hypothetical protein